MNIFIQGIRRSGTTILQDALVEDGELTCFYEPLREQDETPGGGSGAREEDAFRATRELRDRFRRERYPELAPEDFNWGGPRAPAVELEEGLPGHCRELLAFLLGQAPSVAIKETRLYRKVPVLAQLDPEALFVHVVRDPRAVTSSVMYGRRRIRTRYPTADSFFTAHTERKLWSSREISSVLLRQPEYAHVGEDVPDFMRVLVTWKAAFEGVTDHAPQLFGERYLMVRLEDLRDDPTAALARLYELLERPAPAAVTGWAERNVRREGRVAHFDDPRWAEAAELLGMGEALERAGYGELLGLRSDQGPRLELGRKTPSRLSSLLGRARRRLGEAKGGPPTDGHDRQGVG